MNKSAIITLGLLLCFAQLSLQACDITCATCSVGGTTAADCLTCTDATATLAGPPGACSCAAGKYMSTTTGLCTACDISCATCSAAGASGCLTCSDTTTPATAPAVTPGACTCPTGKYISLTTGACVACNVACATCSAAGASGCLTCSDTTTPAVAPATTPGACTCPSGKGISSTTGACVTCDTSCLTCDGTAATDCATCASTMYLTATTTCAACDTTCLTCDGATATDCLTCATGKTLTSGACVASSGASILQSSALVALGVSVLLLQ